MWIALNPSIADESRLDNTLNRIRSFSRAAGCNTFYMTNLFGLVSTDWKQLKRDPDPAGPDNDEHIRRIATQISTIFVAWGAHGHYQNRDQEVIQLLTRQGRRSVLCFGTTRDGSPCHPLHLAGKLKPVIYQQRAAGPSRSFEPQE
jgi:hypothetical protein